MEFIPRVAHSTSALDFSPSRSRQIGRCARTPMEVVIQPSDHWSEETKPLHPCCVLCCVLWKAATGTH